jgi:hypothetical protein
MPAVSIWSTPSGDLNLSTARMTRIGSGDRLRPRFPFHPVSAHQALAMQSVFDGVVSPQAHHRLGRDVGYHLPLVLIEATHQS